MHILAILDTMWGDATSSTRQAPRFFKINPKNFTGRRLYSLIDTGNLIVTDVCKEVVDAAHKHETPDPQWLLENITMLHRRPNWTFDVILVCGKIAQTTFDEIQFQFPSRTRIIKIPHPAARCVWTKEYVELVRNQIQKGF